MDKRLGDLFRKRYLNTHEEYLKSFADITAYLYFSEYEDLGPGCKAIMDALSGKSNVSRRIPDKECEAKSFRNLRNSWYHEVALNNPIGNIDQRLKFAPWKIIQCYYCVFAGISALVRCFKSQAIKSHSTIFNIFGTDFLRNNDLKKFFLPPYNFHLNQQRQFDRSLGEFVNWDYANEYHIPKIIEGLESIHNENKIITYPHYLQNLREWVQYEDAYLFFRLYGDTVKSNLEFSLKRISYGYLTLIELFFINLYGWDKLSQEYKIFYQEFKANLGIEPTSLSQRFAIYWKESGK